MSLFLSCAKQKTLNMKSHDFGKQPKRIVWMQIAGFQEEHLAMLRFGLPGQAAASEFPMEGVDCIGKMWNFNLYKIRPTPLESSLSQLMGQKNIKNSCEDFTKKPVWKYFEELDFATGIFESGYQKNHSLLSSLKCQSASNLFQDTYFWKMSGSNDKNANKFHYQGREQFNPGEIYYDKSCQGKDCYASILNNVKSVWNRFNEKKPNSLFIIRDYSYYGALKGKKILKAREILIGLNKVFQFFSEELNKKKETLLILTSASPQSFEFPTRGDQWAEFDRNGKYILYRKNSLLSPVLVKGAASENFCGLYSENDLIKRMIWTPRSGFSIFVK